MTVFNSPPDFDLHPTSVHRDGRAIVWDWSDGSQTRWTPGQLRSVCPCATCREKKRAADSTRGDGPSAMLPVLSAAEAAPLTVETLRPAGNYAYNVVFSDGHHSGLYTLALLHAGSPP